MRIERRFQFLERRDVRTAILVRHARSAVPSSAGSLQDPLQPGPPFRILPANRILWRHRDFARNPGVPPLPSGPCAKPRLTPRKRRKEGAMGPKISAKIAVGGKAPAFSLPRDGGGEVSLADFKGR